MKNGALFLDRLKNGFDGEKMHDVNKNAVMHMIETKPEVFDANEMGRKSKAAAGICSWLVNIIEFNTVFRFVDPLKKQMEQLKIEAEDAQRSSD